MDCAERQKEIERILAEERKASVDLLARRFKVSEVTIRKDLAQLETKGVLLRTHGGAVLAERPELVIPHLTRAGENPASKERIAREAAKRVQNGEHVLLDAGSTTLALARALRGREVTVVTNSVPIAMELAGEHEKANVIVLGGSLRRSSLALMGPLAHAQLGTIHCDRAFLGASGYDNRTGFCCQNLIEAETKRAMMSTAREVVLLADRAKFDRTAFAPFCPLKDLDAFITEAAPPRQAADAMRKAGVDIVIAG